MTRWQHGAVQGIGTRSKNELLQVPGISDVRADSILAWFGNPENISLATELSVLWGSRPQLVRQSVADPEQGVCIGGWQLAPGDEIVATGAIGVTRPLIKQWYLSGLSASCVMVQERALLSCMRAAVMCISSFLTQRLAPHAGQMVTTLCSRVLLLSQPSC
jgi:hypothetical protein